MGSGYFGCYGGGGGGVFSESVKKRKNRDVKALIKSRCKSSNKKQQQIKNLVALFYKYLEVPSTLQI